MWEYVIQGAVPLRGTIRVQGAKNSVLPILAASVLCSEPLRLYNVPNLSDVCVSISLLQKLGCRVETSEDSVLIDPSDITYSPLEQPDCSMMRSSILFLGPMLGRNRRAELYFPGGCLLGERPIDLHISALEQMGAHFSSYDDKIIAECPHGLQGAEICLRYPSVGATENILMASALAKGETVLYNRAKEPEIDDLIDMLRLMGACITVEKECIRVIGTDRLCGCEKKIMPDRIAAFTYLTAALATDGEITLEDCPDYALGLPLEILAAAGGAICRKKGNLTVCRAGPFILPIDQVVSGPYPAFPTDAGAITLALMSLAQGRSIFRETVFSDRFKVVNELRRFGADIRVKGESAYVDGVSRLQGCHAVATDLRAGAALLVAALAAEGESCISGIEHITRGYENIVETLQSLGALIMERSV